MAAKKETDVVAGYVFGDVENISGVFGDSESALEAATTEGDIDVHINLYKLILVGSYTTKLTLEEI